MNNILNNIYIYLFINSTLDLKRYINMDINYFYMNEYNISL